MEYLRINKEGGSDEKTIDKEKEEIKMRKILLTLLMVLVALALAYGNAEALTGQCSNCHTMHDSQDGSDEGVAGTQLQLLKAGCVSCHTGPHQVADGRNAAFGAPVVLDTAAPGGQGGTDTLAGGDFYWVNADETANAAKGHNVIDLPGVTGTDTNIGMTPPGWDQGATTGLTVGGNTIQVTGGAGWVSQLTCAGTFGCHGTRNLAGFGGMAGAHHGNTGTDDQVTAPTTTGSSFRFLAGISGLEHTNHNWNETTASHNEYYGINDISAERDDDATSTYTNTATISFACAQCHGDFHAKIDGDTSFGAPWVRHPVDIVLPNSGEYDDYNSDNGDNTAGAYNLEAPVARGAVPAASSATVTPGNTTGTGAIVMCLSCHRAHGSQYDDLLRFDYTTMLTAGGNTNGCFVCHTDKN
jgi:predicted CXXCH cytochrome family protein